MRRSGEGEKYIIVVTDMKEVCKTAVRCAVRVTADYGGDGAPLVTDRLTHEIRQESSWDIIFADDIVMGRMSRPQLKEKLERWRHVLDKRGMKISCSKKEYRYVNEKGKVTGSISKECR